MSGRRRRRRRSRVLRFEVPLLESVDEGTAEVCPKVVPVGAAGLAEGQLGAVQIAELVECAGDLSAQRGLDFEECSSSTKDLRGFISAVQREQSRAEREKTNPVVGIGGGEPGERCERRVEVAVQERILASTRCFATARPHIRDGTPKCRMMLDPGLPD